MARGDVQAIRCNISRLDGARFDRISWRQMAREQSLGECFSSDRFGEKFIEAGECRGAPRIRGRATGECDDAHTLDAAAFADAPRDFEAVDAGHVEIEQDRIGPDRLASAYGLAAVAAFVDQKAEAAQRFGDDFADGFFVVGENYFERSALHPIVPALTCASMTVKPLSSANRARTQHAR
jgi:hypothetical protein